MSDRDALEAWGWSEHWAALLAARPAAPGAAPARVVGSDRDRWTVVHAAGVATARIAGTPPDGPLPVTGDWVIVEPGPTPADPLSLTAVLPRQGAISRGAAGSGASEQVLAANVDVVWIVHGLDVPVNARRLERHLAAAWESGAVPEVVLTKADLVADVDAAVAAAGAAAVGVAIHAVRIDDPASVARLAAGLMRGRTHVLLGPSGAGKSTLVNLLAARTVAATGEVRAADRKGRHTTTRRELFRLDGGALLLDTPGQREFRIWALDVGLARTFPEIEALAASCRFRDCRHEAEPGCAVLAAAASGALDAERLASFRKLAAEAAYLERKHDHEAAAAAVARHKTALRTMKHHPKYRRDE